MNRSLDAAQTETAAMPHPSNAAEFSQHELGTLGSGWDDFWFRPTEVASIARLRGWLCLVTIAYLISNWSDIALWYGSDGILSSSQVALFLRTSGLENDARWMISPLFLTDAVWVYQAWLVVGIGLCLAVAAGVGGRVVSVAIWLVVVGWANRSMIASGLAETLLSLTWVAMAIAPSAAAWTRSPQRHWTAALAKRLLGVQGTLVAFVTFATLLAGRVWWNGEGAHALAAPNEDRYWSATEWLVSPMLYEPLTHAIVWSLPLGLLLAWLPRTQFVGRVVLGVWCFVIAVLTSHFLYAATFATLTSAIRPRPR